MKDKKKRTEGSRGKKRTARTDYTSIFVEVRGVTAVSLALLIKAKE